MRLSIHCPSSVAQQLLLLLLLICLGAGVPATAVSRHFSAMDVFELEWVTDPNVSPDGSTIAYTRNGYDVMTDRPVRRVWLVDGDGGNHRPLSDRPGYGARFSPDGQRVAFLSATDTGVEIFMHWLADNRTAHITRLPKTPARLQFSPDGQWLAFSMFTPAPEEPMVAGPTPPEGATWAPGFKVYESDKYRADGQGYLEPGFTHIYSVASIGGAPRQLSSGDFNHGAFAWTGDGSALVVSANRRPDWMREQNDTNLYRIELADGAITQLTDRYGPDGSPAISPDGRYLAWVGYDDEHRSVENSRLHVRDLTSGETRILTETLDRSVMSPVWSRDSRSVYVHYEDSGSGAIARIERNGRTRVLATDLGGTSMSRPYAGGSFHVARNTIAYTRSSPDRPADLAIVDGGSSENLTSLNANLLGHRDLAEVRTIRVPSSLDGQEVEAWLALPPGFEKGRSYPLILEIHGGPFAAYGPHFSTEVQLYAAAGYVVAYANPRGSTSYGAEFANEIHHAYPGGDFDDLMSVVDYAVEEGYADEDRLYVTGGSGGGILTAWIITHTDRFRAAVSAKPVINWYSFVLLTDNAIGGQRFWFE